MWLYQNQEINSSDQFPEGTFGFIYQITCIHPTDPSAFRTYIGKKQLSSNRKAKLTKREKSLTENKRKRFKRVIKETDWLTYWGSSDELKLDIERLGKENFKREILCFVKSKMDLSFWEVHFQIKNDVLFRDSYNKNILGKFYKGKINEIEKNTD